MVNHDFIPSILTWQNGPIKELDTHKHLCEALYNLIRVVQAENNRNTLRCTFFQLTQVQFQVFKGFSNDLEIDPLSLYKLCMWSTHAPVKLTRDRNENIIETFENNQVNTILIKWYQNVLTKNNQIPPEPPLIDSFFAYMSKLANIDHIIHLHLSKE